MTTQIHVIFNPISGQGDAGQELQDIESALVSVGDLKVHLTAPDEGGQALAEKAIAAGADIVVAAGGDGTVSAVAAALVGQNLPMGIIPRGTVNAFAAAMGIPDSVVEACDVICGQHCRRVDTARCGDRTMLLLSSIGFEADLMKNTDRETKNKFGKLAIFVNGLRQLADLKQFRVTIQAEEQTHQLEAAAVTVANAATVSTFLAQGPEKVDEADGLLDITVFGPAGQWSAIQGAADLFMAGVFERPAKHEDITHVQAHSFVLGAEPTQNLLVDGELVGQTPVEISCREKSLVVIVPKPETLS